eukprot:3430588-Rhodomonas_salina.3
MSCLATPLQLRQTHDCGTDLPAMASELVCTWAPARDFVSGLTEHTKSLNTNSNTVGNEQYSAFASLPGDPRTWYGLYC